MNVSRGYYGGRPGIDESVEISNPTSTRAATTTTAPTSTSAAATTSTSATAPKSSSPSNKTRDKEQADWVQSMREGGGRLKDLMEDVNSDDGFLKALINGVNGMTSGENRIEIINDLLTSKFKGGESYRISKDPPAERNLRDATRVVHHGQIRPEYPYLMCLEHKKDWYLYSLGNNPMMYDYFTFWYNFDTMEMNTDKYAKPWLKGGGNFSYPIMGIVTKREQLSEFLDLKELTSFLINKRSSLYSTSSPPTTASAAAAPIEGRWFELDFPLKPNIKKGRSPRAVKRIKLFYNFKSQKMNINVEYHPWLSLMPSETWEGGESDFSFPLPRWYGRVYNYTPEEIKAARDVFGLDETDETDDT